MTIQADGQPEFEMGYDSAGDFYPLKFDALLRPKRKADGTYAFTWFQLGGALEAERTSRRSRREQMDADRSAAQGLCRQLSAHAEFWAAYLRRRAQNSLCRGPTSGRSKLAPVERDIFVAEPVGAEINFARDAGDKVISLTLKQRGQVLRGERH